MSFYFKEERKAGRDSFYLCICVYMSMSEYVHACHACANTHGGQQRALGSLDVGITDVCEPPVVDTGQ